MIDLLFGGYSQNLDSADVFAYNKRQRLPYSSVELAAMEVRANECLRQLVLRCSKALFLLQHISQHRVTRLIQGFDVDLRRALTGMNFHIIDHQLVCSDQKMLLFLSAPLLSMNNAMMRYSTGALHNLKGEAVGFVRLFSLLSNHLIDYFTIISTEQWLNWV